jgi:hypothetical protein
MRIVAGLPTQASFVPSPFPVQPVGAYAWMNCRPIRRRNRAGVTPASLLGLPKQPPRSWFNKNTIVYFCSCTIALHCLQSAIWQRLAQVSLRRCSVPTFHPSYLILPGPSHAVTNTFAQQIRTQCDLSAPSSQRPVYRESEDWFYSMKYAKGTSIQTMLAIHASKPQARTII